MESLGVDVTANAYPVGHESSNFEEIDDMAGFLESVLCPQVESRKAPRSAKIDAEGVESMTEEDETYALHYYLCAIGINDSITYEESVSSAAIAP